MNSNSIYTKFDFPIPILGVLCRNSKRYNSKSVEIVLLDKLFRYDIVQTNVEQERGRVRWDGDQAQEISRILKLAGIHHNVKNDSIELIK